MPQPTTHYLVIRRAIPKEHWANWWDQYKPYFGLGSSAPDLFYFPRISLGNNYCSDLSDTMHSESSYDLFCTMLDIAKSNYPGDPLAAEKQFAFSVGMYAHVVTDCIFHPYVYRSTNDHWNTKNFLNELKHKKEEFRIDRGVHRKIRGNAQEVGTTEWKCPGETVDLLEFAIVDQFNQALETIYPLQFNSDHSVSDTDHPIQQAYHSLDSEIPYLLNGEKMFLWGSAKIITPSEDDLDDHFFTRSYPSFPGLDPYTPEDLFNFSCATCRNVFKKSLEFLQDNQASSSGKFFSNHRSDYLGVGNWNLDTGLPCEYNNDPLMLQECPEHYLYKVDQLKNQYAVFSQLYNPADFE